jgi:hypothetical protein
MLWAADSSQWMFIESTRRPGSIGIFGGDHPDPDLYTEFEKLAK